MRRTAVDLLRIFGGNEALRELSLLLNDADPQVQRDAVRAIVQIGTPEAFAVIDRGCETGGTGRELIVREVIGLRDSRAVPSLAAVLVATAPLGALVGLHEAIIDALAGLGAHTDSTPAPRVVNPEPPGRYSVRSTMMSWSATKRVEKKLPARS